MSDKYNVTYCIKERCIRDRDSVVFDYLTFDSIDVAIDYLMLGDHGIPPERLMIGVVKWAATAINDIALTEAKAKINSNPLLSALALDYFNGLRDLDVATLYMKAHGIDTEHELKRATARINRDPMLSAVALDYFNKRSKRLKKDMRAGIGCRFGDKHSRIKELEIFAKAEYLCSEVTADA